MEIKYPAFCICIILYIYIVLFYLVFFHEHSWFTEKQGKGENILLTALHHFHPLHRHVDISRTITAERSPLYTSSRELQN